MQKRMVSPFLWRYRALKSVKKRKTSITVDAIHRDESNILLTYKFNLLIIMKINLALLFYLIDGAHEKERGRQ